MSPSNITATEFIEKPFDFLIIGGGTAGLVLAARLAENPELTIGVLEAGSHDLGENEDAINIPGKYGDALGGSCDWKFETTAQEGLGGRVLPWPRGKVLGGTSALNFMTWNRGCKEDYDAWTELGNPGWGWNDLLPFFKKSETFHKPTSYAQIRAKASFNPEAIGSNGPIQVSFPKEFSQSHDLWHPTLNSLGVETNVSHLSGSNVGVWTSACSVDPSTSTRSYSASTSYTSNASGPNLYLLTEAVAVKILLNREEEEEEWTAKGVRFEHHGVEFDTFASRETIISAGSVQSPQLLELSGIGGAEILSRAGIEVKVDNPNVGENLQDHLMTMMVFEVDPSLANPDDLKTDIKLANSARDEYVGSKSGPLTILPCSICYLPFSHFVPHEFLSLQAHITTPFSERDTILLNRLSDPRPVGQIEYIFDLGNWSSSFQPDPSDEKKYGTMLQILQYPFSKGKIHIRSPEPGRSATITDKLVIDPEYYAGRNGRLDLQIMTQCQVFALKICSTKPLANIIRARAFPPPSISGDELRDWIVETTVTDWHPVGTCAMSGRGGIKTGVVDERLRVHGVRGLRVVDASIMPLQISAHLQATVYAIAEKAAHMILQDVKG